MNGSFAGHSTFDRKRLSIKVRPTTRKKARFLSNNDCPSHLFHSPSGTVPNEFYQYHTVLIERK